jgi:hypothetical protein
MKEDKRPFKYRLIGTILIIMLLVGNTYILLTANTQCDQPFVFGVTPCDGDGETFLSMAVFSIVILFLLAKIHDRYWNYNSSKNIQLARTSSLHKEFTRLDKVNNKKTSQLK